HLHLYPDQAALDGDAAAWKLRERFGFRFQRLDRDGIRALEPQVGSRYQVGVYLADHATILNPLRYVQAIVAAGTSNGVRLLRHEVRSARPGEGGRWRLALEAGEHE